MIIRRLFWDEWNIEHIAKHHIEPEEVEMVCRGKNLLERGRDKTYQVIGQTETGRYLTVILAPRRNGFYPVTARDSTDTERKRFKKQSL